MTREKLKYSFGLLVSPYWIDFEKKRKIVERDIQPREESFFLASDFFLSSSRNVGTYRLDFSKEENKKGVLNKDQGKWIAMPRHGKVFR